MASGVIFNSNSIGYTDLATADAMALMRTAFQQNQGAVVQAGDDSGEMPVPLHPCWGLPRRRCPRRENGVCACALGGRSLYKHPGPHSCASWAYLSSVLQHCCMLSCSRHAALPSAVLRLMRSPGTS